MSPIPQLIIGLGNPGTQYEKTRHNLGFEILDTFAKRTNSNWQNNRRFKGFFAETKSPIGTKIYLLKPQTYMNLSGESVSAVLNWYKLSPESLLVIYDDMDLPIGRLRLRLSGSAGGHNGMKSIITHIGSQNFPRLRIGIGKGSQETISHVLGKFAPQETEIIDSVLNGAVEAIEISLKEGIEKAMNLYNNRVFEISN